MYYHLRTYRTNESAASEENFVIDSLLKVAKFVKSASKRYENEAVCCFITLTGATLSNKVFRLHAFSSPLKTPRY